MSELVEFLVARFAEDEAAARVARDAHWSYGGDTGPTRGNDAYGEMCGLAESEGASHEAITHAARHDPARVLAECEAKRRILDTLIDMEPVETERRDQVITLRWVCRGFAAVYADHPDYQQEWKP